MHCEQPETARPEINHGAAHTKYPEGWEDGHKQTLSERDLDKFLQSVTRLSEAGYNFSAFSRS